jgi:hypothetical protein
MSPYGSMKVRAGFMVRGDAPCICANSAVTVVQCAGLVIVVRMLHIIASLGQLRCRGAVTNLPFILSQDCGSV